MYGTVVTVEDQHVYFGSYCARQSIIRDLYDREYSHINGGATVFGLTINFQRSVTIGGLTAFGGGLAGSFAGPFGTAAGAAGGFVVGFTVDVATQILGQMPN